MRTHAPSRKPHSRSGAALLVVVLAIVIAAMVAATLTQTALTQRRQVQLERDRAQTFWLAESGLSRAVAELDRNPNYRGEDWRIDVPGPSESQPGLVAIHITRNAETNQPRIDVTAEFPAGAVYRTRLHRELVLNLPNSHSNTGRASSALSPENVAP